MPDDKKSLKSSYDLAMERLARSGEQGVSLTPEQKKAIAEVEQKTKARIAELEIMLRTRMFAAQDDEEQMGKIKIHHRAEIEQIRRKAEEEKERIRQERHKGA